jgi:hypothetical protein
MIIVAQTSDCLNICRPKNEPCFLEFYLAVGLGELLYSVRVRRSTAEVYLAGGDMKDRDVRRYGSSGFYYEFLPIDSSIRAVHKSHSYLFEHLKTLDFSFCTFAFFPKVDRGFVMISLNLLLVMF